MYFIDIWSHLGSNSNSGKNEDKMHNGQYDFRFNDQSKANGDITLTSCILNMQMNHMNLLIFEILKIRTPHEWACGGL